MSLIIILNNIRLINVTRKITQKNNFMHNDEIMKIILKIKYRTIYRTNFINYIVPYIFFQSSTTNKNMITY